MKGTEKRINDFEEKTIKTTHFKQQKEINWKKENKQGLRDP